MTKRDDDDKHLKLQQEVIVSEHAHAPAQQGKVSPVLWPLVAYLAAGTMLLFGVTQLERLAFAIRPGSKSGKKWHELGAGWIALYPIVVPALLVRVVLLFVVAIPARVAAAIRSAVAHALRAARAALTRVVAKVRVALSEAMGAVRRATETTLRRIRALLRAYS